MLSALEFFVFLDKEENDFLDCKCILFFFIFLDRLFDFSNPLVPFHYPPWFFGIAPN